MIYLVLGLPTYVLKSVTNWLGFLRQKRHSQIKDRNAVVTYDLAG